MDLATAKTVAISFMMAFGVAFPALAIGMIGKSAMEAIGRNPEAESGIRTTMILVVAFAEAIAIYVLVAALILKFT